MPLMGSNICLVGGAGCGFGCGSSFRRFIMFMDPEALSRLGAVGANPISVGVERASRSMRIGLSSAILVCRGGPEADLASISELASPASVAPALRFLWTGGALGSLGFLGRRCLGASALDMLGLPSAGGFGLTVLPGFRPGFLRGRPAAVNGTLGACSAG